MRHATTADDGVVGIGVTQSLLRCGVEELQVDNLSTLVIVVARLDRRSPVEGSFIGLQVLPVVIIDVVDFVELLIAVAALTAALLQESV